MSGITEGADMVRRRLVLGMALIVHLGLSLNSALLAQAGAGVPKLGAGEKNTIRITIITDNYTFAPNTKPDWGFSCLIEGTDKTILFDTGAKPDLFQHNVTQLRIDLRKVQQVVISHDHQDHTGGLALMLKQNPSAQAYLLTSFSHELTSAVKQSGAQYVPVKQPVEICRDVFLTGELGDQITEQALVINSNKGLIVITGCAHPGIIRMLQKVRELFSREFLLVMGGFHLLQQPETEVNKIVAQFKEMGISYCGATHCTGERPIAMFKEAYGSRFVPIGTGRVIRTTPAGIEWASVR
jgi:7,8-dihydropterin-6-yl-methyl-4-(beta-D-ribofuranosyl)aminobenzene 5'-phosphate synthase